MTSLVPQGPYSDQELQKLYPAKLKLQLVQILGELTDKGRETTLALGERFRHLYVHQLGFMPKIISDADMIYLRATPMPRALDSVQQSFVGNESKEMDYLNSLISKWMPEGSSRVAVDSHPRISGIMDTINSTLAHGPQTRLPSAFYNSKGRDIIDKIGIEEWFSGYKESQEYRKLGIGALVGDMVTRMVGSAEGSGDDGLLEVAGVDGQLGKGRGGQTSIKFAMSGCHDTTLAGVLSSLGVFDAEKWPPFTSSIAVELFKDTSVKEPSAKPAEPTARQGFLASFTKPSSVIMRKPVQDFSPEEKAKLQGYYVRLRYNDRPMTVPGCRLPGKHLEGDDSFCTLEAFKAIADKFTPRVWTEACVEHLGEPPYPSEPEPAGY
ncbi:MAG: hypothetical protein LQ341_005499 [Variospora aurantia]|nr:MAG: hypothetical protein LQ341_005499 [Variospora aurantia]